MIYRTKPLIYNTQTNVYEEIGNVLYIHERSIQAIYIKNDIGEIYVSWNNEGNVIITKERALEIIQIMDEKE